MKPKQELDKLFDEAAELELEAEQEARVEENFRATEDLSTKVEEITITQDYWEVVGLVNEKRTLEKSLRLNSEYDFVDHYMKRMCLGFMVGAVGIVPLASILQNNKYYDLNGAVNGCIFFLTCIGVGVLAGYIHGKLTRNKAEKKHNQKNSEIKKQKQAELETINQKLTPYNKDYGIGDLVLVDDVELGCSLGEIQSVDGELKLNQQYQRKHRTQDKNNLTKPDPDDLYFTLKPKGELSEDDLAALEEKTLVICDDDFGFYKKTESGFELYTDQELKFLRRPFILSELEEQKIVPRLLVPELNQEPEGSYRVGV